MAILNITDSSAKLNSSPTPKRVQTDNELGNLKLKNLLTFVSDFISPTDEISKRNSSPADTEKKGKPFSYTSENWIG